MFNKLIAAILPYFPKKVVWYFSKKYIAGEQLSEAVETIQQLNNLNTLATIDILGESQIDRGAVLEFQNQYFEAIDRAVQIGLKTSFSLKPSMFGLHSNFDFGCETIRKIIEKAAKSNYLVTIDMEDSSSTDEELRLFGLLYNDFPGHIGIVVQAYLKRTLSDLGRLGKIAQSGHPVNVRLCKGIYIEPAEIAYKTKGEVNENYLKCLSYMLVHNFYPAIATHDKFLIEKSKELIRKHMLLPNRYEFQMLFGVTPHLREKLVSEGHVMRVYVPYGINWFKYSTRRLKENPGMVQDIIMALFTRK